jgi:hypothetical protein
MKKLLVLVALATLLLLACVTSRSVIYETTSRPPKTEGFPIEVYDSVNLSKPYKVIGLVQANAGKLHSTADTLEYLKEEARKLGGDAIVDLTVGESRSKTISRVGDMLIASSPREIWSAKAIVWLEE